MNADGIAYPQWTGRAESVIGVPTPIQTLYEQIEDENYNPVTKKYTLGFKALPGDLAYCTQGPTKLDKVCLKLIVTKKRQAFVLFALLVFRYLHVLYMQQLHQVRCMLYCWSRPCCTQ